ncbi:MAG: DinB family protein [Anaerolineae bacterium]|nr:DinB family protein [Anaerolineae bacterium]
MSAHPLVAQLRFARGELQRCLAGVSEEDAIVRTLPMNCISWVVGHLANQEQSYWVILGQGRVVRPELNELVGYGRPASRPPLAEMWAAWRDVTAAADVYLDTLTGAELIGHFAREGRLLPESRGTMLQRNLYHYWFHIGEAHAMRQMLGHRELPEFVGDMNQAPYRPEG